MTGAKRLDGAAADFDLRDLPDSFYLDPYPTYAELREHAPVHRCPDGSWFLSRYADNLAAYRDHRRLSSDKRVEFEPKFGNSPLYRHHTSSLVFRDPPYHTRVRGLIAHFFTVRALAAMRPRVEGLVDTMLDEIADRGHCDLVADFASALPVAVVCDLLGVPPGDRIALRDWAKAILGALEPVIADDARAAGNRAVDEFSHYLAGLIADKRRRGAADDADMLSALVEALDAGAELTEDELIQNCIFFLNAGHETTTNLIANGINAFLDNPLERARLRAEPTLIGQAVEECLRYEPSNQLGNRRALEPVTVGGIELPAGALITLGIGAANRDPAQFPDPDRFSIRRQPNRHLSFAAGIHTCAGAALARLEGRAAIGRLVARFPRLERTGPIERDHRARFRVVKRLPLQV